MKRAQLILFLLITAYSTHGQIVYADRFKKVELPQIGSPELHYLNGQVKNHIVVNSLDGVLVTSIKNESTNRIEYLMAKGNLISINRGEFGGGLFYFPRKKSIKKIEFNGRLIRRAYKPSVISLFDLPEKEVKKRSAHFALTESNINSFFKYRDTLYYTKGLAHLTSSVGSVSKLWMAGERKLFISRVFDLEAAPAATIVVGDSILFATFRSLILTRNFKTIKEIEAPFWSILYPSSICYINDIAYIGMRGGYASIDLKTDLISFYMLNE